MDNEICLGDSMKIKSYNDIPLALFYRYSLDDSVSWFIDSEDPIQYNNAIINYSEFIKRNSGDPGFTVCIDDLDKRVDAMIDILKHFDGNLEYQIKLANRLSERCTKSGRSDLEIRLDNAVEVRIEKQKTLVKTYNDRHHY